MSTPTQQPEDRHTGARNRDQTHWAGNVGPLEVQNVSGGVKGNNVAGRRVVGPLQGFGKMWQKTYRVRLEGADAPPAAVIRAWKDNFQSFWPAGNRFYAPISGITPGEVAILNLKAGGLPLSTGVMVLYADDESFTLMTPQGHMFSGWITFSAFEEGACTVAQAQVLMRANDPLYEMGLRMGGHKQEDVFWNKTLAAVARHWNVQGTVETSVTCVDPRLQWGQARNIWHNAAIRTMMYTIASPVRRLRGR